MTTTEILTGIKNWVVGKLNLKQNVISDLADIRSGAQAGATSVQPADILSYFDNAVYDSGTHRINFYHGQSVIAYIDASPFIVDGMVNDVRIENGYLVIDFNTDSGKQDISIPLTDIFNPNNYYTKSETDSRLTQKQSEIDDLYARIGYYVCSTEGNVAAKIIVANNYTLGNGGSIKIKMTNANTVNNATLNINSTGAKALYYDGERASAKNSWEAGETVEVYYDGTSFYANNVAGGSGSGDGAFDVSAKYPTSGVDGGNTYTLEGALAVLNANLSASKKKGGMSIKFIHSYDNKYVQFRCIADSFTTDITKWQGVTNEIKAGSKDLVESGGVAERNNTYNFQAHKSLFGEVLRNRYLTNTGGVDTTSRNNLAVTSYIKLNGDAIEITKAYYSQYGPVIAFYNINKTFTHYWNPTGETYDTIIPVTVPASEIQPDDYYVRATIADDGLFVSGFDNLAITSQKANDALLPSLITLSGADRKSGKYIDLSGNEANTTLNNASASPFIIIDGNDIIISQTYYAPGYSCGIAFYDKNKIFTHQYTPNNLNRDINKDVIIPQSVIQTGDVYARTTLWGNGTITSGFKTLAQKAEEDVQKALTADLLALFGEQKKIGYYIGQNGEEQYSGRTDIAVSPYYPLNGEELAFSRIIYSEYGKAVSFYDETKAFISGWNPTGNYGKMAITVPVSDIPSNAVYARVTLADDGEITSGYLTLAQKAENDAQKALEQVLPAYWLSFLANKLPLIHTNQEDNALNGDSFYFLTDYHIEGNAGYSHKIIQYLCEKTTVQNMVYGGDSFNGSTTKDGALEKLREFYYRFYPINMFGLRGNHEFNLNDGGGQAVKLSDNQIYNYLMRKTANEVVAGVASPMYYYRDVDKLKLRYIYLDARYEDNTDPIDDTQIQWMKDRITELQSGWSVILFSHQLFTIVSPGEPVVTNPGYNASGTKIINALTSITPAADIIAIIAGHCHYDFSTNEHGFWEISTTCDARQEYGGLPQTLGTPNEQAFDVFSLNLQARTLKAVRIGRGNDRNWTY